MPRGTLLHYTMRYVYLLSLWELTYVPLQQQIVIAPITRPLRIPHSFLGPSSSRRRSDTKCGPLGNVSWMEGQMGFAICMQVITVLFDPVKLFRRVSYPGLLSQAEPTWRDGMGGG